MVGNNLVFGNLPPKEKQLKKIKPKALIEGSKVGLISPASLIEEDELKNSISNLELLGYSTYYTDKVLHRYGYFAGTDQERAEDLNAMFTNKDVDAIVCTRGGYGCMRILDLLDYKSIKNNPKILIGYSDVTALLFAIYSQTGLITFHGPVGISTFNNFSIDSFTNVLVYGKSNYKAPLAEDDFYNPDAAYRAYTITGGKAKGVLVGGNLSIAVSMLGTKYDVDYKDKILFFEEVSEEPYRIDRMFSQLILAGKFKNAAGIVLGVFKNCERKRVNPSFEKTFTLREVLEDRLKPLGIPVFYGMSFGHVTNKITIPFGVEAEIDADNLSLTFLESAVKV
ncbi:MAG: LD-carboxypeptidase [Ignavibacteriales bacterium]